jgi:hypothetical protein
MSVSHQQEPQPEGSGDGEAAAAPVEQNSTEQSPGALPPARAPTPAAPPPAFTTSPRRSPDFGGQAYTRHIRLAAVLSSCSEQPDLLRELLGPEMIAELLGLPIPAVEKMMSSRPSVRRRLSRRIRERLGLTLEHLACAPSLPRDARDLVLAARYFAVAIRLAGTRRVMSRASFHALNERWGANAVSFGFAQQALLDRHAEVLADYQLEDVVSPTDMRLFVRSLAAHGHAGAPLVALRLGLPVALATARVANLDLALETGLPDVAAAALAEVLGKAPHRDGSDEPPSNDDEAAWLDDATRDVDSPTAPDLPVNPDSTEAA